jgi:hypothetical protein
MVIALIATVARAVERFNCFFIFLSNLAFEAVMLQQRQVDVSVPRAV